MPDDSAAAAAAPPPGGGVNASAEPFADTAPSRERTAAGAPGSGAPPPAGSSATARDADTISGTVQTLGTALDSRVVVLTASGPVAVVGPRAGSLRLLQGMDVWVQGPVTTATGRAIPPRHITAERFEVRGVAGVAVLDGTLSADGEALTLTDRRGAGTRLTSYPPRLRDLVGRRIWVTRAADGAVASFGVIME